MKIVLAAILGLAAAGWTWGAVTGRLASMIAASIEPNWVS